jgi:hypothetical protein
LVGSLEDHAVAVSHLDATPTGEDQTPRVWTQLGIATGFDVYGTALASPTAVLTVLTVRWSGSKVRWES